MHRAACSMVGEPFLETLLRWCEGDDVSGAVEQAREAMRSSANGANGTAGVATGSHLGRTFSKLELDKKALASEEEKAAARRKQLMEINAREASACLESAANEYAFHVKAPSPAFPAPKNQSEKTTLPGKQERQESRFVDAQSEHTKRPSLHAPSVEERKDATERRRVLAAERGVLSAAAER
jgi:hypothetical protein|tara:strand:+ start:456 stop:1001 length:546 start_codon:yes stop_codon:yes gene_type:complete